MRKGWSCSWACEHEDRVRHSKGDSEWRGRAGPAAGHASVETAQGAVKDEHASGRTGWGAVKDTVKNAAGESSSKAWWRQPPEKPYQCTQCASHHTDYTRELFWEWVAPFIFAGQDGWWIAWDLPHVRPFVRNKARAGVIMYPSGKKVLCSLGQPNASQCSWRAFHSRYRPAQGVPQP